MIESAGQAPGASAAKEHMIFSFFASIFGENFPLESSLQ
jgi:hypothetical protein